MNTPEFILWAIDFRCALRDHLDDYRKLETVERSLRPIKAYSDGVNENRIFAGLCFEPGLTNESENPRAFRVDEVLAFCDGEEGVVSHCGNCESIPPKRRLGQQQGLNLAGCHGHFTLAHPTRNWQQDFNESAMRVCDQSTWNEVVPASKSQWYGLCQLETPSYAALHFWHKILSDLKQKNKWYGLEIETFLATVEWVMSSFSPASSRSLTLRLRLNPTGEIAGRSWTVRSHCSRCKAPQSASEDHCTNCGRTGYAVQERIRKSRGHRPFWPLKDFLGESGANDMLARYFAQQTSQAHRT